MTLPRPVYLLMFFASCWSLYYLWDSSNKQVMQVTPDVELPAFSGRSLTNTNYDQSGVRNFVIRSGYMDHYSRSGNTVFEKLKLDIYRDGEKVEWAVSANKGVLDKEYLLHLSGNVVMKNQLQDSAFDTMSTNELYIQLESKDFYTDQKVTLTGPQFTNTGNAMKGNLSRNVATLSEHVQGKYEIQAR